MFHSNDEQNYTGNYIGYGDTTKGKRMVFVGKWLSI